MRVDELSTMLDAARDASRAVDGSCAALLANTQVRGKVVDIPSHVLEALPFPGHRNCSPCFALSMPARRLQAASWQRSRCKLSGGLRAESVQQQVRPHV